MANGFNYDSNGNFRGKPKKIFPRPGGLTLMARCLMDGSIDVCLRTGWVFSYRTPGVIREIKTSLDEDGYTRFVLSRDVCGKLRRKRDGEGRRRLRQTVFVHRLVMMKKKAMEVDPSNWRRHVRDIPADVDVNHIDGDKANNHARNLELQTMETNRSRRKLTREEREAIEEFYAKG